MKIIILEIVQNFVNNGKAGARQIIMIKMNSVIPDSAFGIHSVF